MNHLNELNGIMPVADAVRNFNEDDNTRFLWWDWIQLIYSYKKHNRT